MPLNFITSPDPPLACMFDDTNGIAFGPVVEGPDAMEYLGLFVQALGDDPRAMKDYELAFAWAAWQAGNERRTFADLAPTLADEPPTGGAPAVASEPTYNYRDGETSADDLPRAPDVPPGGTWADDGNVGDVTEDALAAIVPAQPQSESPTPPKVETPVGARECWNCEGHRVEPAKGNTPCGICSGKGWLPA